MLEFYLFWKRFVLVSAPPPVDARNVVPPSHLVPLSSNVAVKKKKRRRERATMLADSRSLSATHGYASPLQPPVISEQLRSPSVAAEPQGRHSEQHSDGLSVEPMTHAAQDAHDRPASRGNRSDSWIPESVYFFILEKIVCYPRQL